MAYIWRRPWTKRPNKQNRAYLQGTVVSLAPTFSVDWTATSSIPASLTLTRASGGTYYNSSGVRTTAATNGSRIEYNPNTLAQQGLLIEEQRTNFAKNAADLSGWQAVNVARVASSTLGADNTNFMTTVTANAGTLVAEIFNNSTAIAVSANQVVSLSADFKKTNYNYVFISYQSDTATHWVTIVADLNAGAVTQTGVGGGSGTLVGTPEYTPLANGIVRISFSASHSQTTGYITIGFAAAATGNTLGAANGDISTANAGTENFLVDAGQFEVGTPATSFISTTTAAVTRSADLLSSTDAGLLAAKGWVVEVGELNPSTAATLLGINTVVGMGVDSTNHLTTADGGTQTTANTGTWSGLNRGGLAWDATPRVSIDLDGGTVVTAANTATTPTALYFGDTNNGASGFLNGHIRMMAGYAAISDAQLPTVTVVGASFTIGGTTYSLAASAGAYALTGSAATVFATRKLAGTSGSYAITGQTATLIRKYVLAEVTGTYALTGSALATLTTRKLPATTGAYALTGQAATLIRKYVLAEVSGAYALTGSAASVFATRKLSEVSGAYALTGQAATTVATRNLSAATGAYTFTGQTATLIRKYVLSETSGSYAITGQTATVKVQLSMTATSGSYFLTGSSAPLKLIIKLPLTSGAYALTGSTAATFATRKLSAVTGTYVLTGSTAATVVTRKLAAISGSFALTGSSAQTFATRKLAEVSGAYVISGQAATLTAVQSGSVTLAADTGSYAITGSDATLVATFISPTGDIYTVSGGQVVDHLPLQDGVEVVRAVSFPGSTTQRQTAD